MRERRAPQSGGDDVEARFGLCDLDPARLKDAVLGPRDADMVVGCCAPRGLDGEADDVFGGVSDGVDLAAVGAERDVGVAETRAELVVELGA